MAAIETDMAQSGFWDQQEKAQATMAELKGLTSLLKPIRELESSLADCGGSRTDRCRVRLGS